MVAGGLVTHVVESSQRQARQDADVSLIALVGSAGTARSDGLTLTMEANLTLVNSGPVPVVVEQVTGDAGGLRFRSGRPTTVAPGVKSVPVTATVGCAPDLPAAPVEAVLTVRTADRKVRETSSLMIVQGTPWAFTHQQACQVMLIDPSTGEIRGYRHSSAG